MIFVAVFSVSNLVFLGLVAYTFHDMARSSRPVGSMAGLLRLRRRRTLETGRRA